MLTNQTFERVDNQQIRNDFLYQTHVKKRKRNSYQDTGYQSNLRVDKQKPFSISKHVTRQTIGRVDKQIHIPYQNLFPNIE